MNDVNHHSFKFIDINSAPRKFCYRYHGQRKKHLHQNCDRVKSTNESKLIAYLVGTFSHHRLKYWLELKHETLIYRMLPHLIIRIDQKVCR